MAFCTNCGAKLEDGAKFCTNCGAKKGQPDENGYVPTEEPVKGEYIPPAENTYFSSAEEEKEAARKKKNRTFSVDELRDLTLKWRGSSNQRVINVKESLEQGRVIILNEK